MSTQKHIKIHLEKYSMPLYTEFEKLFHRKCLLPQSEKRLSSLQTILHKHKPKP